MKKTMLVILLFPIFLGSCEQKSIEVNLQTTALAAARDEYMEANKEALYQQSNRLIQESPQLASYLVLSAVTLHILEECEEVCTPVRLAVAVNNINTIINDLCSGSSLGDRLEACAGRYPDPDDHGSCVRGELERGICP